jgi:hypothetical protein
MRPGTSYKDVGAAHGAAGTVTRRLFVEKTVQSPVTRCLYSSYDTSEGIATLFTADLLDYVASYDHNMKPKSLSHLLTNYGTASGISPLSRG